MKHEIFITGVFLLSHSDMSNSFETPWSVARKAPLSMGNLQARILSGLPCLPSGDLPNPEIKPRSPTLQTDPGKPSPQIWNASWICMSLLPVQFSSVQSLRSYGSLRPHGLKHTRLPNTKSWSLLKCMSIKSLMPSHPLSPPAPSPFNLSQHQGLFQWVSS